MNTDKPKITPAFIRAMLYDSGTTPTKIARQLGVTETSVSNVIRGRISSRRIATEIAKQIGKNLDELWPGQYPNKVA